MGFEDSDNTTPTAEEVPPVCEHAGIEARQLIFGDESADDDTHAEEAGYGYGV